MLVEASGVICGAGGRNNETSKIKGLGRLCGIFAGLC